MNDIKRAYFRESSLRWYHKNKKKIAAKRKQRGKLGLCKYCGKKAVKWLTGCKKCLKRLSEQRKRYWREKQTTKQDRRSKLIKLAGGKCKDCGFNRHPAAFEFDHVRGRKKAAISNMLNALASWNSLLKELSKCELVCSNCHKIRTHNRRHKIA